MAAIHGDRVSLPSRVFADLLPESLVRGWDGAMDPDSVAATVYATCRDKLAEALLDREPFARLATNPFSDEPYPTPAHTRLRTALPRLIGGELVTSEDWSEAVHRALTSLEQALGPDERGWKWSRLHMTNTVHPLSRVFPDHADELNPPSVSCGGDADCVQASSSELGVWVQHSSVARYVFDLGDWDESGWIVPLGSSGHPESAHYADQATDWADVRLRPMLFSWERIEADAESRQVLEPAR
jgi:penicillin amidase